MKIVKEYPVQIPDTNRIARNKIRCCKFEEQIWGLTANEKFLYVHIYSSIKDYLDCSNCSKTLVALIGVTFILL